MYTEHFGLESPVAAQGIARDDRLFLGDAQTRTIADIGAALCRSNSVAIVTGAPGTGKTTLAAAAFREAATQLALGTLTDAPQSPHELLEQLLLEFGFKPYRLSRTERLSQWRQYLGEMAATGTRIGIVVETAENLDFEVLTELERLTSADIRGGSGANLLLTMRTDTPLPADDRLTALRQRCGATTRIAPLSVDETCAFLRFCVSRVGRDWDTLAEPGVDAAIHEASGGAFRMIVNVLESSLARAALAGEAQVSLETTRKIAACLPGARMPELEAVATMAAADKSPADNESPTDTGSFADTASPAASTGDGNVRIPVLDDAVGSEPAPATTVDPAFDLDEGAVALLLDQENSETVVGTHETADASADTPIPEPTETNIDDEKELSDEDRRQIEMLEEYSHAETLEEISESLAETIFGNTEANELSRSLQKELADDTAAIEDTPSTLSRGTAASY